MKRDYAIMKLAVGVILHGVESAESADNLYSAVHGAGRLFGRMEAKGTKNKAGERVRPPRLRENKWINGCAKKRDPSRWRWLVLENSTLQGLMPLRTRSEPTSLR